MFKQYGVEHNTIVWSVQNKWKNFTYTSNGIDKSSECAEMSRDVATIQYGSREVIN